MRRCFSLVLFVLLTYASSAQSNRSTNTNYIYGNIVSITPCETPGIILSQGGSYVLSFEVTGMDDPYTTLSSVFINYDSTCKSGYTIGEVTGLGITYYSLPYSGTIPITTLSIDTGIHKLRLCYGQYQMADTVVWVRKNANGIPDTKTAGNALQVYPSPGGGRFTVNIGTGIDEAATLTVTDMAGAVVKNITTVTNKPVQMKLDVAPGRYLIVADAGGRRYNTQFVVCE